MKKKLRRNTNFKKYIGIFIFLCVGALGYAVYFYVSANLTINKVVCKSQFGDCTEAIFNQMAQLEGQKFKGAKKEAEMLLVNSPLVESYQLAYVLPTTLLVNVIEQKTIYALKKKGEDLYAQLTSDGQVIKFESKNALPFLEVESIPNSMENVDARILFTLKIISELEKSYSIQEKVYLPESLVVKIDNNTILFPSSGDIELLLGSFYTIYNQLNNDALGIMIGDVKPITIDLRFENPVIKIND